MNSKPTSIKEIESRIAELPSGYISRKVINGRERFYRQWREGSKLKSQYIKAGNLEFVKSQIKERKELEALLKEAKRGGPYYLFGEESSSALFVSDSYTSQPYLYLKWDDDVIGYIDEMFNVKFIRPNHNSVVSAYTKGNTSWTKDEFTHFLKDRVPSRERKDIEKILFRCGLGDFDVLRIAMATKAINASDLIWITEKKDEKFESAVTQVFSSIFEMKRDLTGDSVDTPEGVNVKRYGVFRDAYGIYKKRISPISRDLESELAVYKLCSLLGVECCPCYRVDQDTVFSEFKYDFSQEYIVHFRHIIEPRRSNNDLFNLISARPQYLDGFAKMIALDFLTRQDDRHLSNIAVKITSAGKTWDSVSSIKRTGKETSGDSEMLYPLYDNGRSLFYEDTEETVRRAVDNILGFSTGFGPAGSYMDHINTLLKMGIDFSRIMNLEALTGAKVRGILEESGFDGYRLDGAVKWIMASKECLK